jgi:hypothetical protein
MSEGVPMMITMRAVSERPPLPVWTMIIASDVGVKLRRTRPSSAFTKNDMLTK